MNRRGFTLIELIATIAILGVIATISFVSINAVIAQGKKNNCETLVGNIKSSIYDYVSDNRYKSDFVSMVRASKSFDISARELVNKNYLSSPIVNPYTNENINLDDINITVNLNNDYTVLSVDSGITCGDNTMIIN